MMRTACTASLVVLTLFVCGCTYQGVPNHGGGKRFYYEQETLASATRKALGALNWGVLQGKKVNLFIMAIGDEGGGMSSDPGLDLGGFFGLGGAEAAGDVGVGGAAVTSYSTRDVYGAFAFANARDIDYLKGVAMQSIFKNGGMVARDDADLAGDVYLVVDTFGTHRWKRSFIFYDEVNLAALVRLSGYFVDRNGTFTDLGGNASRYKYMANFVLGKIGPLNPGNEITEETPPRVMN